MDSCGGGKEEEENWLAFSLSNHNYYSSSSPTPTTTITNNHHQLYLPLFQHPLSLSPGEVGHVDNGSNTHQYHELPFFGRAGLFPVAGNSQEVVYEAVPEQKTVEASFLGGFHNEQQMQVVQHGEEQRVILSDANNQLAAVSSSVTLAAISPTAIKKSGEGFGHRTSIYRGVTRHRWTGRYEAHLWDNTCRREGQSRKGRQVYLGGYDKEEKAARAYDLAALKYWGPTTTTNFSITDYEKELKEMKNMSRQEFVASLRRKSSGFSRGASIYRGVTRYNYNRGHHQHGKWQARIGRVAGNKDLYLGTFSTQEEAAEAYDIAAIKFRGLNAVTNFDLSRYDVNSIISSNLPVGGMSKSKSISDHSTSDNIKALENIKSNGHDFATTLPVITSSHHPNTTPTHNFATSENYALPTVNISEHARQGEGIEHGLGYGNGSVSQGYDANNEYDGSNDHSGSGDRGNGWSIAPNLHTFQNPKPSLTLLQRAIFGIE